MKEVLFLIPANLTRPYFSSLCCACEDRIYSKFKDQFRPIMRGVPREKKEFDEKVVVKILNREMRQSQAVGLLVVAPTASKILTTGVAKVARERNIPIIALSLPFHHRSVFRGFGIPVPPVVVTDSAVGTRELGKAAGLQLLLRQRKVKHPYLVLIPGQRHRIDSTHRLNHFLDGMLKAGLEPHVVRAHPCQWQRRQARQEMTRIIDEAPSPIDVVFAANDEMALGARDAILAGPDKLTANTIVYGFDAIDEVCSLIEENDHHMRGTIRQDLNKMADALASLIQRSFAGKRLTNEDSISVKPVRVLPPRTGVRFDLRKNWPRAPHLDLKNGDWVLEVEAARIEDLQLDTLSSYRKSCQQGQIRDGGNLGRDRFGRVWRRDDDHKVYYLRSSLEKSKT